jgi:hypothetical protein
MKKNLRIIQINGFRGLLVAMFILSCLIAGFIAFPAFVAMGTWNYLATTTNSFPSINFLGGLLLWGIIVTSILIVKKRKFVVSFNSSENELTEAELQKIVSKIKTQPIRHPYGQDFPTEKISEKFKDKDFTNNSTEKNENDLTESSKK